MSSVRLNGTRRILRQGAALLDAWLPTRCALCAARGAHGFCAACRRLLPWILIGCEVCGAELPAPGVCGGCQAQQPQYDHAIIPFKYREPIAAHIQMLKYHKQLRHASSLATMLCMRVWKSMHPLPELLIPIPLHRKRLRHRGFNQSLEIARRVGKELGVKVSHASLERIKNTAPQTGLGKAQRERNVQGAFHAPRRLSHTHVALLDDVVTSGSTVNAAARALKKAGVQTVSVWAAARA